MKLSLTTVCVAVAASLVAAERDARAFRAFPHPGCDWSNADGAQLDDGQFSWRHHKHQKTGDVVACVAWHAPRLTVDADAVRQASIEIIQSTGYAYVQTRKFGQPIADTVRHQTATINVRNHSAAHKSRYRVIEYTYVYECANGESESAMAHGYVIVVGDFVIFIQHTANRVITSDIAQSMAMNLAMEWSAKQTSLPKGWSAGISRSDK
jgi:hypothetical protein